MITCIAQALTKSLRSFGVSGRIFDPKGITMKKIVNDNKDVVWLSTLIVDESKIYVLKQYQGSYGVLHKGCNDLFEFIGIASRRDRWTGNGNHKEAKSLIEIFVNDASSEVFVFDNVKELGNWLAKQ